MTGPPSCTEQHMCAIDRISPAAEGFKGGAIARPLVRSSFSSKSLSFLYLIQAHTSAGRASCTRLCE